MFVLLLMLAVSGNGQVTQRQTQTRSSKGTKPMPTRASQGEEIGPDDVIRVKTRLVTSPVLVLGREGKFVPNLRREDFHVYENGREQRIAYFSPVEKPFTVALLLDTSRSLLFDLRDIQDAAISFVDKMRDADQVLLVSFDEDRAKVLAEPTTDRNLLRDTIRSTRAGGNTPLYDAVDLVMQRLAQASGRKAAILFTDGVDNASLRATYETNVKSVAMSDVLIYPVQFSTFEYMKNKSAPVRRVPPEGSGFSPVDYKLADAYLHELARQTATSLYPAYDTSDLDKAIAGIVEELHNEYSLGYYPEGMGRPGEIRRLEVRVDRPQLTVRARTGYSFDQAGRLTAAPVTDQAQKPTGPDGSGSLPLPRVSISERPPPGSRWMCKGPKVPSDFAVVKEAVSANCPKSNRPNDETNAWLIAKPGPEEVVCKGFFLWNGGETQAAPIPTGYAVVGQQMSSTCARSTDPTDPNNAWTIRLPTQQETICKGFLVPRGYVVIGEKRTVACPIKITWKNAWVIAPKSDTGQENW